MGDAMRRLHRDKLIHNDFLLFYGDMLCNINLKDAIEEYY